MRLLSSLASSLLLALFALANCASLSAAIPTPEAYFGHRMGADRTVLDWSKVVSYFQILGKESNRIKVVEYGKSTEGRPLLVAYISAPENIAQLDQLRDLQKKLADPRKLPAAEAEKLFPKGKAIVLITCTIHATEIASTPTSIEYAHRLLTDASPKTKAILENTILLLVPSLNPDGLDLVTSWYRQTLGTPYEGTSPPQLYQKYTGHDNNRDWYIFSQAETQATIKELHNRWHPHIVYDVHQQGQTSSRMFVPPWMDPIDPNIDPIIAQWCNAIGMGVAADLTSAGKTGVAVNAMYDFWTPARHYQSYHGGVRILSESASVRIATPVTIAKNQLNATAQGYSPALSSWNHLEVWPGGEWHLRDIVDYQLIAFESILYQAATRRQDLVQSFYRIAERAVRRPGQELSAFVIPKQQADPAAAQKLLETLAFGAVEVEVARDDFRAGDLQGKAGDFLVRLQQPFSSFAKTLLEKQEYPNLRLYPGGPPKRPYDVTAHTLPMLMGVAVKPVKGPLQAATQPAQNFAFSPAQEPAGGLAALDTKSFQTIAQRWKNKQPVYRDMQTGHFFPQPGPNRKPVPQPRIGLYRSHMPQMDEGWTRWLLDTFGWPFQSLTNQQILQGNLAASFDVLLFPDQTANSIHNGYRQGAMPPEITGGLGEAGAKALVAFAQQGGTLIFLNESAEYAEEHLGLGIKNSLGGLSNRDFYCPGSLLQVELKPTALTLGLPSQIPIWMEGSPAWEDAEGVATYPSANLLASGWLLGEKYLTGKQALLDKKIGQGRAVLFGFRPQYRAQSYLTFKLLFNALLLKGN